MKAIRGATTVDFDSIEQVRARVGELLKEIVKRNALTRDEIVFLLFSNTNDICSYYPAKAAREAGFSFCSLFFRFFGRFFAVFAAFFKNTFFETFYGVFVGKIVSAKPSANNFAAKRASSRELPAAPTSTSRLPVVQCWL